MDLAKNNRARKLFLFLPAIFVLLIVLAVYAVNGIYPFGTESIVFNDMGQLNIPQMYSLWDAIHGNGSFLLNLRTAGGVFLSYVYEAACSPINLLFFLICPRDRILDSMSYYLLAHLVIAATTSMLFFSRRFPRAGGWNVLFSILYAFNPFILQYYTNTSWLGIVCVAPLIFMGADMLLRNERGGKALYLFSLLFSLLTQFYLSYMILLFLFLDGAIYIWLLVPKEEQKECATRFGITSVLALLLSSVSALVVFFDMRDNTRVQSSTSYFTILMDNSSPAAAKIAMVIFLTAFPLAIVLLTFLHYKKEKKTIQYLFFSLLLLFIPVLFENVNLLWHLGSFVGFSMRYAFLLHLMLLTAAAYGMDRFGDAFFWQKSSRSIAATVIGVLFAAGTVFLMLRLYDGTETAFLTKEILPTAACVFLAAYCAYCIWMRYGMRRIASVLCAALLLFECAFYFSHGVTTGFERTIEFDLDYIDQCNELKKTLPLQRDGLTRVTNVDATLNSNYPLIIDYPAVSNFTHLIPATIRPSVKRLGYSSVYTRVLDTGGTLFTDSLLGCRYALSLSRLNEEDYISLGDYANYHLYESRYAFGFGLVCSPDVTDELLDDNDPFVSMNNIWHALGNKDGSLLELPQVKSGETSDAIEYTLQVKGKKELYMRCTNVSTLAVQQITANGVAVPIPSLGEPDNLRFPTDYNNNVIDVGTFEDETVTVRLIPDKDAETDKTPVTTFALLDKAALSAFSQRTLALDRIKASAQGRTVTVKAVSDTQGQYLFLPLTYSVGWSCTVNGEKVQPEKAIGTFMAIPLQTGENEIRLSYLPQGFAPGLILSLCGLIAAVVWLLFEKKLTALLSRIKLTGFIWYGYLAADACALTALYALPIICKIYTILIHL